MSSMAEMKAKTVLDGGIPIDWPSGWAFPPVSWPPGFPRVLVSGVHVSLEIDAANYVASLQRLQMAVSVVDEYREITDALDGQYLGIALANRKGAVVRSRLNASMPWTKLMLIRVGKMDNETRGINQGLDVSDQADADGLEIVVAAYGFVGVETKKVIVP